MDENSNDALRLISLPTDSFSSKSSSDGAVELFVDTDVVRPCLGGVDHNRDFHELALEALVAANFDAAFLQFEVSTELRLLLPKRRSLIDHADASSSSTASPSI
jgi:hypothetical protein